MIIDVPRGKLVINPAYLIGALYEGKPTAAPGYILYIFLAMEERFGISKQPLIFDTEKEALDLLDLLNIIIEDFNNGNNN